MWPHRICDDKSKSMVSMQERCIIYPIRYACGLDCLWFGFMTIDYGLACRFVHILYGYILAIPRYDKMLMDMESPMSPWRVMTKYDTTKTQQYTNYGYHFIRCIAIVNHARFYYNWHTFSAAMTENIFSVPSLTQDTWLLWYNHHYCVINVNSFYILYINVVHS